jgi:hypothetical protein
MATQDNWAFLLQHEGDRRWLPLDSPEMAIVEGRYRIIARSRRRNAAAEISIAHTASQALTSTEPPKRRAKKRAAQTNDKGFLLVLPFTLMSPGQWELRCAGDVMSELMGESWQHALKLNVLPKTQAHTQANTQASAGDGDPDWAPVGPAMPITPAAPAALHPIAAIDPLAVELEDIFTPIAPVPSPAPEPIVPAPIVAGEDAISLEDLFGDATAGSVGLPSQPDLAQELATIAPPDTEVDLEVDVWSGGRDPISAEDIRIEDIGSTAAVTQLEIVSDNDETLLDWDATSSLRANAAPIAPVAPDSDDEFSVFDELFSPIVPSIADLSALTAELRDDDVSAPDGEDVLTFTDADALAVTAENDYPIEFADNNPSPSVWGMGTRTGATAQMGVASPVEPISETPIAPQIVEAPAPVAALIDVPDLSALTIALDPSFYNFRGGEVLMIYGQVLADVMPGTIAQGELVVKLADPQTATQVAEYRQPLEHQAFPLAIAAPLSIPMGLNAQLLVGEVALWDDGVEELAQQSFTAMAVLDDLMATIDPDIVAAEFEKAPPATQGGDAPLPPVDFAFFNLIGDAPENAAELAPLKKRESMKDVELPGGTASEGDVMSGFGTIAPLEEVDDRIFSIDDMELENPLPPVETELLEHPGLTSTSGQPLPDDWFDLAGDERPAAEPPGEPEVEPIVEPEIAAIVEPEVEPIAEPEMPVPMSNPDPAASEVVVDDLPEALPTPQKADNTGNPLLIAADVAIPEPTIEILADGELVTGQTVRVRVKLPNILPKLYVKLWINDRQSRTLMDGPRWMVDFVPNGRDELETMTQLTVPFGSLEIQIAAITVEASTKRESYRTSIDRTVIPPNLEDDLPELNFDNF